MLCPKLKHLHWKSNRCASIHFHFRDCWDKITQQGTHLPMVSSFIYVVYNTCFSFLSSSFLSLSLCGYLLVVSLQPFFLAIILGLPYLCSSLHFNCAYNQICDMIFIPFNVFSIFVECNSTLCHRSVPLLSLHFLK